MFEIKRLWLDRDKKTRRQWTELLEEAGLDPHEEVEYTIGAYDGETLAASASYDRNIIKCLAVNDRYRSENLLTQLMILLMERLREEGKQHFFVYTKPQNKQIFSSLGFRQIIENDRILFMEQGTPDFNDYQHLLEKAKKPGRGAAIVMNANPFTKGHQYLAERAASVTPEVYVFVLSADRSEFSDQDRFAMVQAGLAHLKNVTVLPTNDYLVSSATFPSYFLKEKAQADLARVQADLDSQLFKEKIAPLLAIDTRFVGEEPYSQVTAIYNQEMKKIFQPELQLVVVPRLEADQEIISATKVRQALKEKNETVLKTFLPETTLRYLKNKNLL